MNPHGNGVPLCLPNCPPLPPLPQYYCAHRREHVRSRLRSLPQLTEDQRSQVVDRTSQKVFGVPQLIENDGTGFMEYAKRVDKVNAIMDFYVTAVQKPKGHK